MTPLAGANAEASQSAVTATDERQGVLERQVSALEQELGLAPGMPGASLQYRLQQIYASQLEPHDQPELRTQAIRLYNQAIDQSNAGQSHEAMRLYAEAVRFYPGLSEAYNNWGALLEAGGQYAEAAKIYWQALTHDPDNALLYRNLGVAYEKQGLLEDALVAFRSYLKLSTQPDPQIQRLVSQFETARGSETPDYFNAVSVASRGILLTWPARIMPVPIYIGWITPEEGQYVGIVTEAMKDWEQASQGRLRFKRVDSPLQARIELVMMPGPLTHSHQDVGHTAFHFEPKATLPQETLRVKVRVNTGAPGASIGMTDAQRVLAIRRYALHEIGHALGIWGHSDNPRDVMFTHPLVSDLSLRDKETARLLYAAETERRLADRSRATASPEARALTEQVFASRWLPTPVGLPQR